MPQPPPSSRDKLLDVGEALFARRGFAGVGMREVARAAGLGKSSLFHHFSSKTELYHEVLLRAIERFRERLAPVFAAGDDPLAQLDRLVDGVIDALAEQPGVARLLLRTLFEDELPPGEPCPEAQAVDRAMHGLLADVGDVVQAGADAGVFRRVSVPHTLQSLIGLTIFHFASGELGDDLLGRPLYSAEAVRERKAEVRQLLRSGLASAPARPPEERS